MAANNNAIMGGSIEAPPGLIPGANVSGGMSPLTGGQPRPSLGSPSGINPLLGKPPIGQQMPAIDSPMAVPSSNPAIPSTFPANGPGASTVPQAGGANPISATGVGAGVNPADLQRGFQYAGDPRQIAQLLSQFILGGAGYNPQVLQALFAQLQPQINRGEANIMEQFGAMGLGAGSPAAIGLGDYLSQVNLNEGEMAAQLYEQSVQNMMNVLMGTGAQSAAYNPRGGGVLGAIGSVISNGLLGKGIGSLFSRGGGSTPTPYNTATSIGSGPTDQFGVPVGGGGIGTPGFDMGIPSVAGADAIGAGIV